MQSKAKTVEEYLQELPEERRGTVEAVREVVLRHLPEGIEERMTYGMIGYVVPHSIYPNGYHCDPRQPLPFAGLASQKNYFSLYLMSIYQAPELYDWLCGRLRSAKKKVDVGKSCIRFKKLEDLALDVIGEAVEKVPLTEYVRRYESGLKPAKAKK